MRVTFPSSDKATWPTTMSELDPSERLIVWSFRRWVLGLRENRGEHWSIVWNEFVRQFGAPEGKEALSGFAAIVKGLQCHARRMVHHHQPCCPCLGADEAAVMCLVAACQSQRPHCARAIAEGLVEPDGVGELLQAGTRLARIMRQHSLIFPERTGRGGNGSITARPETIEVTVH